MHQSNLVGINRSDQCKAKYYYSDNYGYTLIGNIYSCIVIDIRECSFIECFIKHDSSTDLKMICDGLI